MNLDMKKYKTNPFSIIQIIGAGGRKEKRERRTG